RSSPSCLSSPHSASSAAPFFSIATATTGIYTLSLHDALPISHGLERVALPKPPGSNPYDGGWIQYSYHPSVLERVQPLIKEAETFKAELTRRLGHPVLERVDVRIARTPREMRSLAPSEGSVPSYASGVAYSQIGL